MCIRDSIISEIAPYLGIATDGIDRSQNTVKVPNLVGKEWSNAQVSLNTKGDVYKRQVWYWV